MAVHVIFDVLVLTIVFMWKVESDTRTTCSYLLHRIANCSIIAVIVLIGYVRKKRLLGLVVSDVGTFEGIIYPVGTV